MTATAGEFDNRAWTAIGAGVLAGIVTLLGITAFAWYLNNRDDSSTSTTAAANELDVGDCFVMSQGTNQYTIVECTSPHIAEVTSITAFGGDADSASVASVIVFAQEECTEAAAEYMGIHPLDTASIEARAILPDSSAWSDGDQTIICFVQDTDKPLTQSLKSVGSEIERSDQVAIRRIKVGECFTVGPEQKPEGRSEVISRNVIVSITSCDDTFHGLIFGRSTTSDAGYFDDTGEWPGAEATEDLAREACQKAFLDLFDKEIDGFNYIYWSPSEASWTQGDRQILCAIVDLAEGIEGPFNPSDYTSLFELANDTCFALGPDEQGDELGLDDQVLTIGCSNEETHGHKIGSGSTDLDDYPGETSLRDRLGAECVRLYTEEYGEPDSTVNYKFLFAQVDKWRAGDQRFVCLSDAV